MIVDAADVLLKLSFAVFALVPEGVVTRTSTVPIGVAEGTLAVICASLFTDRAEAETEARMRLSVRTELNRQFGTVKA